MFPDTSLVNDSHEIEPKSNILMKKYLQCISYLYDIDIKDLEF